MMETCMFHTVDAKFAYLYICRSTAMSMIKIFSTKNAYTVALDIYGHAATAMCLIYRRSVKSVYMYGVGFLRQSSKTSRNKRSYFLAQNPCSRHEEPAQSALPLN